MPSRALKCRECGAAYQAPSNRLRQFCSTACRRTFNNRRATRGADVYDLVMSLRFDREEAKARGIFSLLCRMASNFRAIDHRERQGRKSWADLDATRNAHHASRVVGLHVAGRQRGSRG